MSSHLLRDASLLPSCDQLLLKPLVTAESRVKKGRVSLQGRDEDLALGVRVASAAVGVIRRTDAPSAIAGALAAVTGGDLALAAPETEEEGDELPPPSADALLPLYPPGQAWTRTLGLLESVGYGECRERTPAGLALYRPGLPPFDGRLASVMQPARAVCAGVT